MNTVVSTRQKSNQMMQNKQQGSSLMLALFILIVLTLLGGALVRVLSTSSEAIAQEVIGTRALMAANSGMQAHLQQLFPLSGFTFCPLDRTYDFSTTGSNTQGLHHCKAYVDCVLYFPDPTTGVNYFRLTSTGECGSGVMEAGSQSIVKSSRTIQVEARSL